MELAATVGMSEGEFWQATPIWFAARQKAHAERVQSEWERARYAAFFAVVPHVNKGAIKQPSDLGKFPWEQAAPKFAPVDPDVMKAWHEKAKERLLKKK